MKMTKKIADAPESQNPSQTGEGGFGAIVTRSSLPLAQLTAVLRSVVTEVSPQLRVNAIIPVLVRSLRALSWV